MLHCSNARHGKSVVTLHQHQQLVHTAYGKFLLHYSLPNPNIVRSPTCHDLVTHCNLRDLYSFPFNFDIYIPLCIPFLLVFHLYCTLKTFSFHFSHIFHFPFFSLSLFIYTRFVLQFQHSCVICISQFLSHVTATHSKHQ